MFLEKDIAFSFAILANFVSSRSRAILSGRVFIVNTILNRGLEPFLQKLGELLQYPGEKSYP